MNIVFIARLYLLASMYFNTAYEYSKKALQDKVHKVGGNKTVAKDEFQKIFKNFPPLHSSLDFYGYFSTVFVFAAIFRYLLGSDEFFCYFPGKIAHAPSIIRYTVVTFCVFHLSYRLLQVLSKPHIDNLMVFMLQDKTEIEESLAKFTISENSQHLPLTAHQKLLRHVLCYRSDAQTGIRYHLRPNRTSVNHEALFRVLVRYILVIRSLVMPVFVVVFAAAVESVYIDANFLTRYPGCDLELERMNREGKLSDTSITITPIRLWIMFFDHVENLIMWPESDIFLTGSLPYIMLINYDLIVYWRHIGDQIRHVQGKLKSEWLASELTNVVSGKSFANIRQATSLDREEKLETVRIPVKRVRRLQSINPELSGLKSVIRDFFALKRDSEKIASDTLTCILLTWMIQVTGLQYSSVVRKVDEPMQTQVHLVPTCTLAMLSVLSFYMLQMNRLILRSYTPLCSIMAFDCSGSKKYFAEILDYFVKSKSYAFKLFRHYPYESATYFSLVGWTLSGAIVIQNFCRFYLRV